MVRTASAGKLLASPFWADWAFPARFPQTIIKSSKLYWGDSGCYLLGIASQSELERAPFLGRLFDGIVTSEILKSQVNRRARKGTYQKCLQASKRN